MNATVYKGQQGFFECLPDINYRLEPTVTWYSNGTKLDTDMHPQKYFVSPNTKTLLLSQVDDNDAGDYHCVLTNSAGNVSSSPSVLSVMSGSGDDDMHYSGDDGESGENCTGGVPTVLLFILAIAYQYSLIVQSLCCR